MTRPPRLTVFALGGFALLSLVMVLGLTTGVDDTTLRIVDHLRSPERTDIALFWTMLGNGIVEVPFGLGAALLLAVRGHTTTAKRFIFTGVLSELLYLGLKAAFRRPRPSVIPRLGDAGWYSYPSGHSMLAPIIWSLGFALLASTTANKAARMALATLAVVMPICIALSRLYLGVHYPSDVLGGLVLGSGCAFWGWSVSRAPASIADNSESAAIR